MSDRLEELRELTTWSHGEIVEGTMIVELPESTFIIAWAVDEIERLRVEVKTLQNVRVIKGDDISADKSYGKFPEGYDSTRQSE